LLEVLQEIGSDKYKEKVLAIRQEANPSKSPLKDLLPVFTPTGRFKHRSIAGLMEYNGLICLDLDYVENVTDLKSRAINLPYVYAAFITPSGKGLKVLVKTDATYETYKAKEMEVADAFFHDAGHLRDNHCKDIARIQFVSYDPEVYINENSSTFN
jgi:ribonuclease BN (tRNA processing enzyme)